MGIPGAAHIDQSYWKGNAEKHTGENNAEACHDVAPLAKVSKKTQQPVRCPSLS
jgi:hypothetical protein